MYLTDFHSHSNCSPDGRVPVVEMAMAGVRAGLSEMCITDHLDLVDFNGRFAPPYNWKPLRTQYARALRELPEGFTLRLGVELGSGETRPEEARRILDIPELDFVIASVHNYSQAKGGGDFYFGRYETPAACYEALDDYFASMTRLAAMPDCYDVLGHIIYPLRYMNDRDGQQVSLARYMPQITEIVRTAAEAGRGMEVNTWRGRTIEPWRPILECFKAQGGTLVTVGADAHTPEGVGRGVAEAYALLREVGFTHFATYEKRKPILHPL